MSFAVQTMAEIGASARRATSEAKAVETVFSLVRREGSNHTESRVSEFAELRAGELLRVEVVPVSGVTRTAIAADTN